MNASERDRVLVIMAKAPRPGEVKTRLTSSLSPLAAAALYRCLLDDTLELACSLGDVEVAIMCPSSHVHELGEFAGSRARVLAQTGEGLAAGLSSVFAHFAGEQRRRTLAFNADSPHLPRALLETAFETLTAHDLVAGPTSDGGYYLVGAKASYPTLFAGDGMGHSSALERLLARAQGLNLSVGMVAPFYDIDVIADLTQLAAELRAAPARAPRTAAWLREWQQQFAPAEMQTGREAS